MVRFFVIIALPSRLFEDTIIQLPEIFKGASRNLLIVNLLSAMAYSFVLPIMSMFLVDHLGTDPIYIGIFTVSTAVMSLLVNRKIGNLIDAGLSAKALFLTANACLVLTGVCFALLTEFWQAVLVGLSLFAMGNSSIPILLVLIRRHADQSNLQSTELNAQMRGGVSLMWILGPALAFSCIEQFGFTATYLTASSIAFIALLMAIWLMPDYAHQSKLTKSENADIQKQRPPIRFWLLAGVTLLGNFSNGLYIVSMPLYIKLDLGLTESSVGIMMGLTAALEVPMLLLAPRLSRIFGRQRVYAFAFIAGSMFYLSLLLVDNYTFLLVSQILNGIFFGTFAGLAISILQDELPERTGYASSSYTNAMRIGSMFGSTSAGILAQFFGYQFSFVGSVAGTSIAFCLLILIRYKFPKPNELSE